MAGTAVGLIWALLGLSPLESDQSEDEFENSKGSDEDGSDESDGSDGDGSDGNGSDW